MVFRQPELLPGEAFFKVGLDNHMLFVLIYFIDSLRTSEKRWFFSLPVLKRPAQPKEGDIDLSVNRVAGARIGQ